MHAVPSVSISLTLASLAAACGIVALGCAEQATLTQEQEENLLNFARSIRENRLAKRAFNKAMGSGSGVVTIPKGVVDDLIQTYERALELSRRTKSEVLSRVHPELARMVRDHHEKQLELYIEALRTGSTRASLEAQRHDNAFGDWWDRHRKKMPLLKRVMKNLEAREGN